MTSKSIPDYLNCKESDFKTGKKCSSCGRPETYADKSRFWCKIKNPETESVDLLDTYYPCSPYRKGTSILVPNPFYVMKNKCECSKNKFRKSISLIIVDNVLYDEICKEKKYKKQKAVKKKETKSNKNASKWCEFIDYETKRRKQAKSICQNQFICKRGMENPSDYESTIDIKKYEKTFSSSRSDICCYTKYTDNQENDFIPRKKQNLEKRKPKTRARSGGCKCENSESFVNDTEDSAKKRHSMNYNSTSSICSDKKTPKWFNFSRKTNRGGRTCLCDNSYSEYAAKKEKRNPPKPYSFDHLELPIKKEDTNNEKKTRGKCWPSDDSHSEYLLKMENLAPSSMCLHCQREKKNPAKPFPCDDIRSEYPVKKDVNNESPLKSSNTSREKKNPGKYYPFDDSYSDYMDKKNNLNNESPLKSSNTPREKNNPGKYYPFDDSYSDYMNKKEYVNNDSQSKSLNVPRENKKPAKAHAWNDSVSEYPVKKENNNKKKQMESDNESRLPPMEYTNNRKENESLASFEQKREKPDKVDLEVIDTDQQNKKDVANYQIYILVVSEDPPDEFKNCKTIEIKSEPEEQKNVRKPKCNRLESGSSQFCRCESKGEIKAIVPKAESRKVFEEEFDMKDKPQRMKFHGRTSESFCCCSRFKPKEKRHILKSLLRKSKSRLKRQENLDIKDIYTELLECNQLKYRALNDQFQIYTRIKKRGSKRKTKLGGKELSSCRGDCHISRGQQNNSSSQMDLKYRTKKNNDVKVELESKDSKRPSRFWINNTAQNDKADKECSSRTYENNDDRYRGKRMLSGRCFSDSNLKGICKSRCVQKQKKNIGKCNSKQGDNSSKQIDTSGIEEPCTSKRRNSYPRASIKEAILCESPPSPGLTPIRKPNVIEELKHELITSLRCGNRCGQREPNFYNCFDYNCCAPQSNPCWRVPPTYFQDPCFNGCLNYNGFNRFPTNNNCYPDCFSYPYCMPSSPYPNCDNSICGYPFEAPIDNCCDSACMTNCCDTSCQADLCETENNASDCCTCSRHIISQECCNSNDNKTQPNDNQDS